MGAANRDIGHREHRGHRERAALAFSTKPSFQASLCDGCWLDCFCTLCESVRDRRCLGLVVMSRLKEVCEKIAEIGVFLVNIRAGGNGAAV